MGQLNTGIKNLWIRSNGQIFKNSLRELIRNLDDLPFPDRDIYFQRYPHLAEREIKFNAGRGCPFLCSFCFNKGMIELYKGKGRWVRFKSIDRIMHEIEGVNDRYPIKWVSFNDDTFNIDKKRLIEFLKVYKQDIGIPFFCNLRIDYTDEDQIERLKQAGVDKIVVGIEHGDEDMRKNILHKNISNKQIYDFGRWVNERKIRLHTSTIMGFPEETVDLVFSSIEMNSRLKPELALANILSPYPGTDIYRYIKDGGYLEEDFNFNEMTGHNLHAVDSKSIKTAVKNKNMPLIINLRCFFPLLVYQPWLKPLVKLLIHLPHNYFYEFIWRITSYFKTDWKWYGSWKERKDQLRKLI